MDLHRRIPGSDVPQPAALLALPGVLRTAAPDAEGPAAETVQAVQASFGQALELLDGGAATGGHATGGRVVGAAGRDRGAATGGGGSGRDAAEGAAAADAGIGGRATWRNARGCRRSASHRRWRCSRRGLMCGRSWIGWRVTLPVREPCSRRVRRLGADSISWCRSSIGRRTRCAASRPRRR